MTLDGIRDTIYRARIILTNKYDTKILIYFFMTVIGGILEMLSIGLLVPIIYILSDSSGGQFANYINEFFDQINLIDKKHQLVFLIGVLTTVYFIKNIFLGYVNWIKANITAHIIVNLSNSFFSRYVNKSILYHTKKNSATVIRDVLAESSQFAKGFIFGILSLVFDFITLISVFLVILFTDFQTAILISSFFLLISLFFGNYFRNILRKWAIQRQFNEKERLKNFQESIGGIKEVKILGKVPLLVNRFSLFNKAIVLINRNITLLNIYPKLVIEFALVFFISLILIYFLYLGYSFDKIMLILGILSVCSLRLMPVITKIINSINMLQYSKPSIDVLYKYFLDNEDEDYDNQNEEGKENIKFINSLKLENVSFSYDDKTKPAIKNINLNINHSDIVGIVGPTGSGKSTIIDLVLGLIKPLEGDIKVDDLSIIKNRSNWNKLIGYVPQNIFLSDNTIKNNISLEFEDDKIDNKRIKDLLKICNLENFVSSLPKKENTIIGEKGARLSGGQKQRIGIARALYRDPSLLIFDEATNALDFKNEQEIMEKVLKEKKRTVIMITHRLETLKFCNYVYKIENGKLFKVEN
tara:strand:+ start:1815 stop:3566 length:1752 start_codon:yes stop_codon:yes gene_type:complete